MTFIYDGTHLGRRGKEPLFIYTNGISLWVEFDMDVGKQTCEVRLEDEIIKEFDKISSAEVFIEGMKTYAEKRNDLFIPGEYSELPEDVEQLQREIKKLVREKEQAQKLAEKLVQGVMKNKLNETEQSIQRILEKHANDL